MKPTKQPWGDTVDVVFSDDIAFVYFNRPDKKNCMSPTLNREMYATLHALELDDRCKVVVLSGRGAAIVVSGASSTQDPMSATAMTCFAR